LTSLGNRILFIVELLFVRRLSLPSKGCVATSYRRSIYDWKVRFPAEGKQQEQGRVTATSRG